MSGYRAEHIVRQMIDGGDFKATLTHKIGGGMLEFTITTNESGSAITMVEPDEARSLFCALDKYLQAQKEEEQR